MPLDLNCDLGEGEPPARTRALMRWVTSASVACGGHAGDLRSMVACVGLAKELQVRLGAHPGYPDRTTRGRGQVSLEPRELELLLLHQVSALAQVAKQSGVALHHIKLHGALYHATDTDPALAAAYLASVRRWWPNAIVYVRAGGRLASMARKTGVRAWEEAFADRAYRADGRLVPRAQPGALLTSLPGVRARVQALAHGRPIRAIDGTPLSLRPQTLCLHSDTAGSVALARAIATVLRQRKPNPSNL